MAEIDAVRHFSHKSALVAYAGIEAPPFQSSTFDSKSRRTSKRGSPYLRRSLFQIASVIIQHSDPTDPILQFMDKKQAESKQFYVYNVASVAIFLRINAYLAALDTGTTAAA